MVDSMAKVKGHSGNKSQSALILLPSQESFFFERGGYLETIAD